MWKSILVTGCIIAGGILIGGGIATGVPAIRSWITDLETNEMVGEYIRAHPIRKLQIGAGGTDYPGWLNTDIEPGPKEAYLDATTRFPIPDQSIHYIFGEHVIEHLSYEDGLFMLRECYRVLVPGGKIRLSTPNLMTLVRLFEEPKTEEAKSYLRAKIRVHNWPESSRPESIILNLQLTSFGHQFVYDPDTLSRRLEQAGFRMMATFPPGESDDPELRGLESRHDHTNSDWREMSDYESMILQAVRP